MLGNSPKMRRAARPQRRLRLRSRARRLEVEIAPEYALLAVLGACMIGIWAIVLIDPSLPDVLSCLPVLAYAVLLFNLARHLRAEFGRDNFWLQWRILGMPIREVKLKLSELDRIRIEPELGICIVWVRGRSYPIDLLAYLNPWERRHLLAEVLDFYAGV